MQIIVLMPFRAPEIVRIKMGRFLRYNGIRTKENLKLLIKEG